MNIWPNSSMSTPLHHSQQDHIQNPAAQEIVAAPSLDHLLQKDETDWETLQKGVGILSEEKEILKGVSGEGSNKTQTQSAEEG